MLRIRLLGGFKLAPTDGKKPDRLGPKPQALLAFLAMSRGEAVPRGQLAGLLWGERDEEHARHSLSQALTTIRATLGPAAAAVLQSSSDGVRLAKDEFELDVDAFERSAGSQERKQLHESFDLYHGEFLKGVEIREPGFEDWLLGERYRLEELAAKAFSRLLDLQIAEADGEAAIQTARRLIAIAPLDESAHARLIAQYASLGRRGQAKAHYERCVDLLRRDLGQGPGEELQAALAEARRRSPGRLVIDLQEEIVPQVDYKQDDEKIKGNRRWTISTIIVVLLIGGGVIAWKVFDGESASECTDHLGLPISCPDTED
jgi:DNA-binding SARP family transcriptional activator